ncbi:MAG: competence/damage-inducible protein A [Bacteroidales bacterium]|nr:competence/damage-inducible protein A [Bacteroidales bacterium]MDD4384861.1 competence/damage-inducible protein A [Bacteroidales bacterium]MDY0198959.1 competence/damage-inducible protein A [Tenuifilaceae bacterium]
MNAAILTIGEEILIGQIVDTNSAWMATELNNIGVSVRRIVSISDSLEEIKSTVNELFNEYEIVLVTGGLGPTNDDITKHALCELFNAELIVHKPTLDHVAGIFAQRGLPLTELNAKQAEEPNNCEVLFNPKGTAPAMLFRNGEKILVSMPGVPFEMKAIMELHVIPEIKSKNSTRVVYHKNIQTFGLPESFLAERISTWEQNLPENTSLAYLPSPNAIRLRLSTTGTNISLIKNNVQLQIEKLKSIIPDNIFGYDDDTMAIAVARLLIEKSAKVAVAESCTGGTIAQLLTENSGSSKYFLGGVVAYSNSIKVEQLKVSNADIEKYGAVSQQTVEAMAKNVRSIFKSDYAIATSGIAGPTGATQGKPVGTVWIAISTPQATVSEMHTFGGDRYRNILRSSVTALNMLRRILLEEKKG